MKKAVLLLGMVMLMAGCIYLKNLDKNTNKDTVLYQEPEKIPQEQEKEYPVRTAESVLPTKPINTGFAFLRLNPQEQIIYEQILTSLVSFEQETELSTIDSELLDKAFHCVMLDHPEIFYVDGYKYTEYTTGESVEKIVFSGKYLYEKDEVVRREKEIESALSRILSDVPDTEDDYLKVKYVYDTLIKQTDYAVDAKDSQNICSVFLNKKSVCQGYAKAMQYILNKIGIESTLLLGTVSSGEGHAWNLVLVNGEWYHIDATWGDAFYLFTGAQQTAQTSDFSVVNYDYLCVPTEQIQMTHHIDMPIVIPECSAMKDNYYVREGLFFSAFEEGKITRIFEDAILEGREAITIKCSDEKVYYEMYRILLDEQKIFEYLSTEGTVVYIDNEVQKSLTFFI